MSENEKCTRDRENPNHDLTPPKKLRPSEPIIKSQPNFVFASWLCSKLGFNALRTGHGVIDIAGGNGLLSFELTCRYGIPSTVIDPRQMKFNSILKRRMKKLTKNRLSCHARLSDLSGNTEEPVFKWENCVIKVEDDYHVLDRVKDSISENNVLPFRQFRAYFEWPLSNLVLSSSHEDDMELLSNASMFVGMHPDQATEHIIDTALALKKPFAVVPCCVFTKLFPHRRTPKGEEVRSYEDLLCYLQNKDPDIQKELLPYDCGRNVVLYKFSYS
mmetsp:Transcript_15672/g.26123  ORF Transcript_15672/g.26123 Transcript_15672/m.26123 type:complete len:273 (-) Transcript_15672:53-871(-)